MGQTMRDVFRCVYLSVFVRGLSFERSELSVVAYITGAVVLDNVPVLRKVIMSLFVSS